MAVASRGRAELTKQWRAASPERTVVWTEPGRHRTAERKVPVVYYLSRNGNLEQPHFMEVSLPSSSDGLYLRDVINRLNMLRGKGLASMYSWSSKRCYKNGFVWHDLTEEDFIYPAHGHEYVLKGSELLQLPSPTSHDIATSSSSSSEIPADSVPLRRRKTPWGSFDLAEYKPYKSDPAAVAADASTQTDDRRPWLRAPIGGGDRSEVPNPEEIERDEISPPHSSSSPETLETLIKADGRTGGPVLDVSERGVAGLYPSGRARASAVLINLISCGAISVKDREDFAPAPRCRTGVVSGGRAGEVVAEKEAEMGHVFPPVRLEDKEYFSGSLIETKKNGSDGVGEFATLKRSNSYNADRCSMADGEIDGVRAKCMPRKPKSGYAKKDNSGGGAVISRSSHGSKRIADMEVPK